LHLTFGTSLLYVGKLKGKTCCKLQKTLVKIGF